MFNLHYRLWLLKSIATFFLIPIKTFLVLRLIPFGSGGGLNTFTKVAICVVAPLASWVLDSWLAHVAGERLARSAGCQQAPLIRGRSWGGLDLAQRFAKGLMEDYPGFIFDDLLDEVGAHTARMNLLGTETILTRDPEVLRFVVSSGFPNFHRGQTWALATSGFFRKGIFSTDGEPAKWIRGITRPYFARHRLSDFEAFQKNSDKVIAILKEKAVENEPCDFQDVFERFTMDTAAQLLFGDSELNMLDRPLILPHARSDDTHRADGYEDFAHAYSVAKIETIRRFGLPPPIWAILDFFNDPVSGPMESAMAYLEPLASKALSRKGERVNHEGKGLGEEDVPYLEHLAASTDDIQLIKDQIFNMMVAGRDTTAFLMTTVVYLLARYPAVMSRLRDEIALFYAPGEIPTYENMKRLKYLRAVINETLRVYPPISQNVREIKHSCKIPTSDPARPFFVARKGTNIFFSVISIHKRKDIWGKDAEEFDPQRWLDEGRTPPGVFNTDSCTFMPFHGGPRICLGMDLAYVETSFMLIRLLQVFDHFTLAQADCAPADCLPPTQWQSRQGRMASEEFWPSLAISMYSKGGMWLKSRIAD